MIFGVRRITVSAFCFIKKKIFWTCIRSNVETVSVTIQTYVRKKYKRQTKVSI